MDMHCTHGKAVLACLRNTSAQNSLQMNLMTSKGSPSRALFAVYRSASCLPTLKPAATWRRNLERISAGTAWPTCTLPCPYLLHLLLLQVELHSAWHSSEPAPAP